MVRYMEEIKDRIIKMRGIWRLTQEKVAGEIGVSLDTYRKIESGEKSVDLDIAMKLTSLFKITLDYLMKGIISKTDEAAINRPLTREEKNEDKMKELKDKYSPEVYSKWKDLLFDMYCGSNRTMIQDKNGNIYPGLLLKLNDLDFISELVMNGCVQIRTTYNSTKAVDLSGIFKKDGCKYVSGRPNEKDEEKIYGARDYVTYTDIIILILKGKITDPKFIDYLCKVAPVELLNYYYLTEKHITEKENILKCLDAGGYVLKVVDFQFSTDYSNDEYGEEVKTDIFGKDVLGTFLLREYCTKK